MMNRRIESALRTMLALLAAALVAHATQAAEEWPTKPVKIIAPFSPGGSADTLGRVVAEKLSTQFKQNFVVENRPGAGGVIGSDLVAKSPPDGYTFVVSGIASHVIAPALSTVPFDPMKSFTHIALLGGPPIALAVGPNFPAKTLKEFVAHSNATKEGIAFGSPGQGTHGHVIGLMFASITGAKLIHVPYKGAAPAMADLIGDQLPAAFVTLNTADTQVRAGRARLLAVTLTKRLPNHAQVPTFAESGYPQLVGITWFSLSGPAGIPTEIVERLNLAVREALVQPDVRKRLEPEGIEPNNLDPTQFANFVRSEVARWTPFARLAAKGT